MDQLRVIVRRASFRLAVGRFVHALLVTSAIAVGLAAAVLIAERMFAFETPWPLVAGIAAALAIAGAAVWAWAERPREVDVARLVDERAGLRESISTALYVGGANDPWSVATVDHARRAAAGVKVERLFPARTPSIWWAPFAAAAALLVMWLAIPQGDVLGWLAKRTDEEQKQNELTQAKVDVRAAEEELKQVLSKMNDPKLEEALNAEQPEGAAAPKTAEEVRREAIRKLTSVQDRLSQIRQSPEGQKLDATQELMKQLKQPGPGPMNEAVAALQRADFKAAAERLNELSDKLASGEMTAEEKEKLREQLEKLAEQLKELAKRREALAEALKGAGLGPSLANDPEALKKALDQMQNLTDAQKQQLQQMAEAMRQACEQCNGLGQAMKAAAEAMAGGENGAAAMGELGEMLSEAEMLAEEMAEAEAAAAAVTAMLNSLGGECEGGGEYEFNMWDLYSGKGRGTGGQGGQRDSAEADSRLKAEKAPSKTQQGPIIGTRLVQGVQVRGESRAEFEQVVAEASASAAEAIENQTIPREDQDAVKRYFGRLKKKVEAEMAPQPPAEPAEPAQDAPAKSS